MSIKKLVIGVAVVAVALGVAVSASAQTMSIAELQAMIAQLTAQIAALQGGGSTTGGTTYTFTRDLTVGSTGADVAALQDFLKARVTNSGLPAVSTQYFGNLTKAALAKYQTSVGISPAVGYFGPLTRTHIASLTPIPGDDGDDDGDDDDDTPSALEGGAGSVSEYELVSGLQNEKVGEDAEDVEVYGLNVEADEGSDLELTAIKLVFNEGTAGSDFEDYATEVSVWLDGEEFARVDADAFTSDNAWTKTVSLDDGAIIKAGEVGELTVAVSGISNLDSSDATDTWTLDPSSIRFVDARGDSTSEDPGTGARTFSFESYATATNAELRIAADDEDINDPNVIDIHASDDTEDVTVMSFTMEAKGNSDLTIDKFTASTTVTGAANVDDIVKEITLWVDGEQLASGESIDTDGVDVGATEDYLFDDLDYVIEAGDKVDAEIKISFLSVADDLDEGDTIQVNIKEDITDQTTLWDVRDESNTKLADADITGSVQGGAHTLYDGGIKVEFVSQSAKVSSDSTTADEDTGTFSIVYKVTAFGTSTIYVTDMAEVTIDTGGIEEPTTDEGLYSLTIGGTATAYGISDAIQYTTAGGASESANGNIALEDGESTTVTLTVARSNDATTNPGGVMILKLEGVAWGLTDTAYADATYNFNVHDFNLTDFKTDALSVN